MNVIESNTGRGWKKTSTTDDDDAQQTYWAQNGENILFLRPWGLNQHQTKPDGKVNMQRVQKWWGWTCFSGIQHTALDKSPTEHQKNVLLPFDVYNVGDVICDFNVLKLYFGIYLELRWDLWNVDCGLFSSINEKDINEAWQVGLPVSFGCICSMKELAFPSFLPSAISGPIRLCWRTDIVSNGHSRQVSTSPS